MDVLQTKEIHNSTVSVSTNSNDTIVEKVNKPKKTRKTRKVTKTTKANEEIKNVVSKSRKVSKKSEKVIKSKPKKNVNPPILKSELDIKMNYLNRRLYHTTDQVMKVNYQNYLNKLMDKNIIIDC